MTYPRSVFLPMMVGTRTKWAHLMKNQIMPSPLVLPFGPSRFLKTELTSGGCSQYCGSGGTTGRDEKH